MMMDSCAAAFLDNRPPQAAMTKAGAEGKTDTAAQAEVQAEVKTANEEAKEAEEEAKAAKVKVEKAGEDHVRCTAMNPKMVNHYLENSKVLLQAYKFIEEKNG